MAIGDSYALAAGRATAAAGHVKPVWNTAGNGWTATLKDGTVLWWSDNRSIATIAGIAVKHHLEGAAVWELSTTESLVSIAATLPLDRVVINSSLARGVTQISARGLVALTFDDGPDSTWTPQILAILAKYNVPATFFDIGMNAEANPGLVQQEISSGNIVGNHTYSHLDLTAIPQWRAQLEIKANNWVLQGITGREPDLFRSPYGAQELTDAQSAAHQDLAASLGMQPVGWNVDSLDWTRPGVARIVANATGSTAAAQIILMHDGGGDRSQTVAALPLIIEALRA